MKPPFAHKLEHHPAVLEDQAQQAANAQLRLADKITDFAGLMPFVASPAAPTTTSDG
ncbi:hypothetical protein AB0K16_19975 [Nonomuraea jabiensis]|uniref:hypothetical protein n=1 Tax=Nonomuraea jabiensis TaxID=882448 RepID=UPI00343DADB1